MKRTDWLILTILLLSPVIVNYILLCPSFGYKVSGTQDGWLSFYGALVGSLITMFVLYRTRRWNKDDNDETRKMQAKVLQYQAKRVWFENLRKQLDDNYRILDFQDVTFMDSSGIAVVINTLRNVTKIDGKLEISGLGQQPLKVFRASGIDKLVNIKEAVK